MNTPRKVQANAPLRVPALRAHMGDWFYYITFLTMQEIDRRVSIADEIYEAKSLAELVQRRVTQSGQKIAEYLNAQPQRLFNSLVLGAYGGAPRWFELSIDPKQWQEAELPNDLEGSVGILAFSGEERLFPIDGQRRVVGIRSALKNNPTLGNEEVAVLLVGHKVESQDGKARTRRLFTTLNRYAKPVNKTDIIALDEDDLVAIITRRLVEDYALFKDKCAITGTKSIQAKDTENVTTIVTLYDALDFYLNDKDRTWKDFKRFRPTDRQLEDYEKRARTLWDEMLATFDVLQQVADAPLPDHLLANYRHKSGGHLLFRPIGLLMAVKVVRYLRDGRVSLRKATQRLSLAPMTLAEQPWQGLIWDTVNQRIIYAPESQRVATRILFHALGGNLGRFKGESQEKLEREWAGLTGREPSDVHLPSYLNSHN